MAGVGGIVFGSVGVCAGVADDGAVEVDVLPEGFGPFGGDGFAGDEDAVYQVGHEVPEVGFVPGGVFGHVVGDLPLFPDVVRGPPGEVVLDHRSSQMSWSGL